VAWPAPGLQRAEQFGNELRTLSQGPARFHWKVSSRQVYAELKRLEERGLISGEERKQGWWRRREYALTPPGREAREQRLGAPRKLDFQVRDEVALKLSVASEFSPAAQLSLIRVKPAQHRAAAEKWRAAAGQGEDSLALVEHALAVHETAARCCEEIAQSLDAK
jgi:DNA-binding PadR family transcriptional regulator